MNLEELACDLIENNDFRYLDPLLEEERLARTISDKPQSSFGSA